MIGSLYIDMSEIKMMLKAGCLLFNFEQKKRKTDRYNNVSIKGRSEGKFPEQGI